MAPANWSALLLPLTPTCVGIDIIWISYPLFFSHQQVSLISYTNVWVLKATFRVCRAFKELVLGENKLPTRTASPYLNQSHKNRWHLQSKHFTWFLKTKAGLETTSTLPPFKSSVKNIDEKSNFFHRFDLFTILDFTTTILDFTNSAEKIEK
jgi:hypothetical protein